MTFMHSLSLNHTHCSCTFVIDCDQWQICRLLSLNHTQCSGIFVIDYGQWQLCSYWVEITLSNQCIFVIDYDQWHICRLLSLNHTQFVNTECKLFLAEFKLFLAVFKIFFAVFDLHMVHICHWSCHWPCLYYPSTISNLFKHLFNQNHPT